MGIDLNKFRPLPQSKCRDLLNLPHDVKLVLYVGRFNYFKGLPLLIEEMYKLKTENAELVCVGGVPGDPLYHMVKKKVKFCFGRVPHNIMPYFYNACDVLAYFGKMLDGEALPLLLWKPWHVISLLFQTHYYILE